MSVWGVSRLCASRDATMATPRPKGNRSRRLFPRDLSRLLLDLGERLNPGPESALQERLDLLVEFLERGFALDLLAVDKEGRRRINLEHLAGVFLVGGDLVQQRLVFQATVDRLRAEAGLLADPRQRVGGVLHHPVVLLPEQEVDDREISSGIVLGDAARQHRAGGGLDIEREFAEHITYLAGVDIF